MITLKGKMFGCDVTIVLSHPDSEGKKMPTNTEVEVCASVQKQLQSFFDKTHQCGCPPDYGCKYICKDENAEEGFFVCDVLTSAEDKNST
jgi:hypothetical protein